MVEVKGYTGTVVFDGQSITIIKTGVGRVSSGRGQIRIPVRSVTAVMWKPAGPVVNGYIHFSVPGGTDRRSRSQSANVRLSPNTVSFLRSQMQEFEALRNAVEEAIQHGLQPTVVPASITEQIAQFAALRDQGILTEEEFAAKKASLLSQT
jgi:hypothetical protein